MTNEATGVASYYKEHGYKLLPGSPIAAVSQPFEYGGRSDQLTLTSYQLDDAEALFALIDGNRIHFTQFDENWPKRYQSVEDVTKSIIAANYFLNRFRFCIWNISQELVGLINMQRLALRPDIAVVGYDIGEGFTGRGYAGQALRTMMQFAGDNLGITTFYACIQPENRASVRTVEKLGYVPRGFVYQSDDYSFTTPHPNFVDPVYWESLYRLYSFEKS